MNTRLVESLVQIIQSLTLEEQNFLQEKLRQHKPEAFNPPIDEYIYISRDERTAQLFGNASRSVWEKV